MTINDLLKIIDGLNRCAEDEEILCVYRDCPYYDHLECCDDMMRDAKQAIEEYITIRRMGYVPLEVQNESQADRS